MTIIGANGTDYPLDVPGFSGEPIVLSWAALTDRGLHRSDNEDSVLAKSPIFAVADGMGGYRGGELASSAVVTRLDELVASQLPTPDDITAALRAAVADIARAPDQTDDATGTTVSGIAVTAIKGHPCWLVFNIGDSRVYNFADGALTQLTLDHSVVQRLIDGGIITPEEAELHPQSHVITRAVGLNEEPIPDFFLVPIVSGSRLVICSDGLTKELTDYGIGWFLSQNPSASAASGELLRAALENGGRDNVSVVVVDVIQAPEASLAE